jgi:hypothetical protein
LANAVIGWASLQPDPLRQARCPETSAGSGVVRREIVPRRPTPMQFLNQLIQFLQQGIAAIFKFVQLVWTWSITQVTQVAQSPWQSWPLWKQVLLVLVLAAVVFALFKVAKELWEAGERVLAAFATLLGVFVRTLPQVVIAGLIAMGGVWLINNLDLSSVRIPTAFSSWSN